MKYLDKEEKQLIKEIEAGKWKRVKNFEQEKRKAMEAAKNTLNKMRNINLRVSIRDLMKVKSRAEETGIPYQTLVRSLIRQYASGQVQLRV
jgi:predicted DNA binding CopG/RHH family protein